jgi:urease accessory protein
VNVRTVIKPDAPSPDLQRSAGTARLVFKFAGCRTEIDDLYQAGSAKIKFPRRQADRAAEAVLINTTGGLTDHDLFETEVEWSVDTTAIVTTQACERIYKSRHAAARIETRLVIGANAIGLWLPQETILFDGGRFERRIEANLDEAGAMLACEALILGRKASGETVKTGAVAERWRIRRGGRLIFADDFAVAGDFEAAGTARARLDGAVAFATIIYAGSDAAGLLDSLRRLPEDEGWAASHIDDLVAIRLQAQNGAVLRAGLTGLLQHMMSFINDATLTLPRVWSC